jgi:hypothetical protein
LFSIGSENTGAKFHGMVDEARVFTFAEGAFQLSDLAYPVPEPSSLGAFVAALVTLVMRRRLAL